MRELKGVNFFLCWVYTLLVGFVIAMIFGHGPLIFPALLRRVMPFRSYFYVFLAVLTEGFAVALTLNPITIDITQTQVSGEIVSQVVFAIA